MIWEQNFWLYHLSRMDKLLRGHGVWLIARHEGDVYILDVCHFGDVLGITCYVDAQSVNGQDEAVVPALGVEFLVCLRGVVGRYCLYVYIIGYLEAVTI